MGDGIPIAPLLGGMGEPSLRILLVDQNAARAAILEEGLREAGLRDITIVRDTLSLLRRIVELERANQQLEERKLIERAKGILMKERDLSESDAYSVLRKAAMNENRRIID